MSGILDQIDETLDDWRGSVDSARWRPEPTPEEAAAAMRACAEAFRPIIEAYKVMWQQLGPQLVALHRYLLPLIEAMEQPAPKTLNADYHQRLRNRVKRKNRRR